MNARLGVYMWGVQVFRREAGSADPAHWREKLASAKGMDRTAEHPDNSRNAPGFVAAICVRDHWDEMSPEENEWCIDVICSEIARHADQWGTIDRVQRFSMLADRPCAFVVPLLLSKPLTEAQTPCVRQAFAAALTHPIDEVRWYAIWGMNGKVWVANPALALRAVNAIATEAALADRYWNSEGKKRYDKRRTPDTISAAAAEDVRRRFWTEGEIAEDAHVRFDITEIFGAEAHAKVLAILGQVPNEPLAVAAHRRASEDLAECWNREHDRSPDRRDRNFHREQAISDRIQQFAMRASDADAEQVLQPILDAVDRHPREVHNVIQGFTSSEDSNPNTPHYWFLWNLFAERVKRAKWLAHLDREHPHGSEVLSTIFLTAWRRTTCGTGGAWKATPTTSTRSSTRCRRSGLCWTATSDSSTTLASVPCQLPLCASRTCLDAVIPPTCCASPTPSSCSKFFSNGMSTHGRWNSSAIRPCARRSCMCSMFLSRAVLPLRSGCGMIS